MTVHTVRILGMGYTPPRNVVVKYYIEEDELANHIELPLELVTASEIVARLETELPKLLSDTGRAVFKKAARDLFGKELKVSVQDNEGHV